MATKMETLYADLADYLVFDKQKYTLEEFFSDIKTFKDGFKQVSVGEVNFSNRFNMDFCRRMIQY